MYESAGPVTMLIVHTLASLPERNRRWWLVADSSTSRGVLPTVVVDSDAEELAVLLEITPDLQCCDVDRQIGHIEIEQAVVTPVRVVCLTVVLALVASDLLVSSVDL